MSQHTQNFFPAEYSGGQEAKTTPAVTLVIPNTSPDPLSNSDLPFEPVEQEPPLTLTGRVSQQIGEIRSDIRQIREAHATADPEQRRRRRILGLAAGVVAVASGYATIKYDLPPFAVVGIQARPGSERARDRVGAAKILRDTAGHLATRTRAKLLGPAIEHGRPANRRRLAGAMAAIVMATNLHPVAPTETPPGRLARPAASTAHTGRVRR
ncbi:MAG TPA: hypothetical protein VFM05_02105 [Candidatus Saccharimonadales bacterium]|nr:hypothetical protein [Candidatus Saccharimonadales bacterium]